MDRHEEEQVDDPGVPVRQQPQALAQAQPQALQVQPQALAPQAQPQAMAQAQPQAMLQQQAVMPQPMYQPQGQPEPAWPQPAAAMPAFYPSAAGSSPGAGAAYYMPYQAAQSPQSPVHPQVFHQPLMSSPVFNAGGLGSPAQEMPSFHINRQRYNLRSQLAPRVTLPWERRERAGRPNAGEALLRNLYELGLIQPGTASPGQASGELAAPYQRCVFPPQPASASGVLYGGPPPMPQAQNPGQVGMQIPAQNGLYQPQAQNPLQGGMLPAQAPQGQLVMAPQAPQQAAQAQAQNGAQAQQQATSHTSGFDCAACRCSNPNGVMVPCGHKICSSCFERQMAVKAECPDPRCTNVLTRSSFIPFK